MSLCPSHPAKRPESAIKIEDDDSLDTSKEDEQQSASAIKIEDDDSLNTSKEDEQQIRILKIRLNDAIICAQYLEAAALQRKLTLYLACTKKKVGEMDTMNHNNFLNLVQTVPPLEFNVPLACKVMLNE